MIAYKTTYCLDAQLEQYQQHILQHKQHNKEPITPFRFCFKDENFESIKNPTELKPTMSHPTHNNLCTSDITPYLFIVRETLDKLLPSLKVCLNTQPLIQLTRAEHDRCSISITIYSFGYQKEHHQNTDFTLACDNTGEIQQLPEHEYLHIQQQLTKTQHIPDHAKLVYLTNGKSITPWLCVHANILFQEQHPAQLNKLLTHCAQRVYNNHQQSHPNFLTLYSTQQTLETTTATLKKKQLLLHPHSIPSQPHTTYRPLKSDLSITPLQITTKR